ncbi:MAG: YgfZ/GcvT domain-containing protein [Burkholderiaceae bacterium]
MNVPVFAQLEHLGMLTVSGEDAARFLHGQLTQDVESMDSHAARRAGYCNAKGRLYATLMLWRPAPDQIHISAAANSCAFLAKRLSMFVLRAKAKVADASGQIVQIGLWGPRAAQVLQDALLPVPAELMAVSSFVHGHVTAVGAERHIICVASEHAQELAQMLAKSGAQVADASAWRAQDIAQGIAFVDATTQEQFVPQMINFELIGGVNFKKGCYPGQEVVARSQYLGKLKRRTAIARAQTPVAPMMDVLADGKPEPVGVVVNAEPMGTESVLLFESTLAAQEAGGLSVAGAALQLQPLPYEIQDITA